jgi:photosystem II stability/assembly factor-like uncharacterized protein
MKKIFYLIIMSLLFQQSALTQEGWFWQNPMPQGNHLNSIKFISDEIGWAVGDYGTIIRTMDGGATWIQQFSGTTENLKDVYFITSSTGIIVGTYGLILRTSDGGTTWTSKSLPSITNNLWGIAFIDVNNGLISGSQILLATTDSGLTWNVKWSTVSLLIDIAMIDPNIWIAVGSNGMIYRTTNAGTNWNSVFYGDFYSSISFSNATNGVVVGGSGKIRRTTNGGVDWILQTSGTTDNLIDVLFTDATNGYAIGWNGTILKTSDGGVNWSPQASGTTFNLLGICFPDFNNGYIVGEWGTILKTTNSGTNWLQQSSGIFLTSGELRGISFYDNNNGFAVGVNFDVGAIGRGVVLKTSNGGVNWIQQFSEVGYFLDKIQIVDQNKVIVVGNYQANLGAWQGLILKTSDAGTTWSSQIISEVDGFTDLSYSDTNNGTIVGTNGAIWRTTNGGTSWNEQLSGTNYLLRGVSFIDSFHGTVVGEGGTLLRTSNGGSTWFPQDAGLYFDFYDVNMLSANVGYIVGMQGIFKTTNGGNNWVNMTNLGGNKLFFINIDQGWFVAGEGYANIYRTTDGGISWSSQFSKTNYPLHDVNFVNINEGWVVGKYGTILHTTNGGVTFIEVEPNPNHPKSFLLSQNYPNPFNPATTIAYQIPQTEFVTLKVYDILGREVAVLVNEEKPAGSYEIQFNSHSVEGRNLTSGIYFYQINAGEYSETKKMILLR